MDKQTSGEIGSFAQGPPSGQLPSQGPRRPPCPRPLLPPAFSPPAPGLSSARPLLSVRLPVCVLLPLPASGRPHFSVELQLQHAARTVPFRWCPGKLKAVCHATRSPSCSGSASLFSWISSRLPSCDPLALALLDCLLSFDVLCSPTALFLSDPLLSGASSPRSWILSSCFPSGLRSESAAPGSFPGFILSCSPDNTPPLPRRKAEWGVLTRALPSVLASVLFVLFLFPTGL